MKQIKKLDTALAREGFSKSCYDGSKLAIINKINELIDAFNKLDKTTRKIVFEDKEEKQRAKDRAMAEALVGVYTQGWDKYK